VSDSVAENPIRPDTYARGLYLLADPLGKHTLQVSLSGDGEPIGMLMITRQIWAEGVKDKADESRQL
jgi:hypothetical protein